MATRTTETVTIATAAVVILGVLAMSLNIANAQIAFLPAQTEQQQKTTVLPNGTVLNLPANATGVIVVQMPPEVVYQTDTHTKVVHDHNNHHNHHE